LSDSTAARRAFSLDGTSFVERDIVMKNSALVVAVALACGGAFAAQNYSNTADNQAPKHQTAAAENHSNAKGGGVMDKTKRFFQRAGDKVRQTGNSLAKKVDKNHKQDQAANTASSDTRSMGAAGSDTDSARRQRMDDAYGNYRAKQAK
jgi:hypothetical protein